MALKMKSAAKKCSKGKFKRMRYSSYRKCMSALMSKKGGARSSTSSAPKRAKNGRRTTTIKRKIGGKKGQTVRISISKPRSASKAGMVSRKSIAGKKRTARKALGKAMTAHRRRVNGIISRIK